MRLLGEVIEGARRARSPGQRAALCRALDDHVVRELVGRMSSERSKDGRSTAPLRQRVFQNARVLALASEEPLTIEQLCELAGTNQRTLHRAFHEGCGVSAQAYLKATRLNRVRKLLRHAEPGKTTVAEAANRHGFWHMGQLAADYREHFGELPSATLARDRLGLSSRPSPLSSLGERLAFPGNGTRPPNGDTRDPLPPRGSAGLRGEPDESDGRAGMEQDHPAGDRPQARQRRGR